MGVSGGVWECGKPERFSIISMPPERGGKGGGDFLFKAPEGAALWLPPFSPLWVCRMYEKRCKEWRISK